MRRVIEDGGYRKIGRERENRQKMDEERMQNAHNTHHTLCASVPDLQLHEVSREEVELSR